MSEDIKTSEIANGCAMCGNPLGPCFHVVDTALAVVDPIRAQTQMGLETMFAGRSDIASALGFDAVFSVSKETRERRLICQPCMRKTKL